jgi:chromodomain-helicase-DNA-binding protein 1
MLVASGQAPPSRAEVRFSSRRNKQVTNYNEEEEDDFEEEVDDENIPNYGWSTTVEDTGPAIDMVLDHRTKDGIGMSQFWLGLCGTNQLFSPRSAPACQNPL